MKITAIRFYGGARDKIARLGLAHLFLEIQQIILDTKVLLLEVKDANSGSGRPRGVRQELYRNRTRRPQCKASGEKGAKEISRENSGRNSKPGAETGRVPIHTR